MSMTNETGRDMFGEFHIGADRKRRYMTQEQQHAYERSLPEQKPSEEIKAAFDAAQERYAFFDTDTKTIATLMHIVMDVLPPLLDRIAERR